MASGLYSKSADNHSQHYKGHVRDQNGVKLGIASKGIFVKMTPKHLPTECRRGLGAVQAKVRCIRRIYTPAQKVLRLSIDQSLPFLSLPGKRIHFKLLSNFLSGIDKRKNVYSSTFSLHKNKNYFQRWLALSGYYQYIFIYSKHGNTSF